ncbi:hypothetical protein HPB48_008318 [Haemaphysalis longicornis]|uniref:Granulins domain-containing protein n=1 Tax=Haemaphysalis longicornis TaxID=44386 RepID=A0A9J6FIR3_HAELO|nr:hypothetical protein HPB48_008318 [Haemaphysalis longicornis]
MFGRDPLPRQDDVLPARADSITPAAPSSPRSAVRTTSTAVPGATTATRQTAHAFTPSASSTSSPPKRWIRLTPVPRRNRHRNDQEVGNVRCPDGNYCQDGQTCCLLTSGSYGCCPYQHAECCSDHSSCCPEGYRCKISTHQCIHATTNHTLPMLGKVEPIVHNAERVVPEENEVGNIRCPDGNYCLDGQTCCLLTSGRYGCCPYQHAQCCSDHSSCCPEGYQCRVSTHQCIHATTNHTLPMLPKGRAHRPQCGSHDAGGECYGCCPYQHAECCSDHMSCCPEGYQCRISTHQCIHATTNHTLPMLRKVGAHQTGSGLFLPAVSEIGNVRCPDGNYCQDGQTCCLLASGSYGCCPYQHAECCSDHSSCCPEGYQCKISTHQCIHATTNHSIPMLRKVDPIVRDSEPASLTEVGNIRCPDGNYCQDGQTCCLLTSGSYGCCPYQHAQCCSDHTSCCPEGYQCRVSTHQCIHATTNHTLPMLRKVDPIVRNSERAVEVRDGE